MESVFSRFDCYDFDADPRFQDGLKVLHESNRSETKLQDMKLFFYNRFVEPIDRTSYKQWSSSSPRLVPSNHLDQETPSDSSSDVSKNHVAAETSADSEVTQLSFAEVMRLIQEGKEIPGAIKLDVKPSNQSPTPSQMERKPKPWEVASSSK